MAILSVVVPTRNRASLAASCIRNVLRLEETDLELVVQDNSDNATLARIVDTQFSDPRLCYVHLRDRVDVIQNFDRALACATGEYVCLIGDDDGVGPEIVRVARWADANSIDAVVTSGPARYTWPDIRYKLYGTYYSSTLTLRRYTNAIQEIDPTQSLQRVIRSSGQKRNQAVQIYYGIVRRSCLEEVMKKTGTYFPGPSPDVAGAVALGLVVKRAVRLDHPLFVPGVSGASTGGWGAAKRHVGELKDQAHLPQWSIHAWSDLVPKFFSGETIWAEDVVQSLSAMERQDLLKEMNISRLFASCIVFHPRRAKLILASLPSAITRQHSSLSVALAQMPFWILHTVLRRFRAVSRHLFDILFRHGKTLVRSVVDIDEAGRILDKMVIQMTLPELPCQAAKSKKPGATKRS